MRDDEVAAGVGMNRFGAEFFRWPVLQLAHEKFVRRNVQRLEFFGELVNDAQVLRQKVEDALALAVFMRVEGKKKRINQQ